MIFFFLHGQLCSYHCECQERYRQCLENKNTAVARDLIYEADLTHIQSCYRLVKHSNTSTKKIFTKN